MNSIQAIRERLGVTQAAFAAGIGCTQGNVGHMERGQTVMPPMAVKIIDYAESRGLQIGFDHVYGRAMLPEPTDAITHSHVIPAPVAALILKDHDKAEKGTA